MCGICGFISDKQINPEILKEMNNTMTHRGPDDSGEEIIMHSSGISIGLAHRRLSVVDLSKKGHQPMLSADGSVIVIFNGEIYNYRQLRDRLDYPFKSQSDTEVILAAYLKWGINCLSGFNGVFSIALYDRRDDTLYLIRDRIGEKPLYYGYTDGSLVFASELKAIRQFPGFMFEVNRDVLALYAKYNYIPAPYSIYKNINKLMPGHYAAIRADNYKNAHIKKYWDYVSYCTPADYSRQDVVDETERLLTEAVRRQMSVDVPYGSFLSGGIDSSLVTALMQKINNTPVNTYTIGFNESDYNEAVYASKVAEHLKTNHTEYYVSPKEAMDVIPKLPLIYDEPFADSSQIPTYLVSQLAGKDLKVVLTGDGGDEMFCGYNSYYTAYSMYNKMKPFPALSGKFAGSIMANMPLPVLRAVSKLAPARISDVSLRRMARMLMQSDSPLGIAHATRIFGEQDIVSGAEHIPTIWDKSESFGNINNFFRLMMAADIYQSLPDDMCVKVDRATMRCSLESRAPLMDIPLIEFSTSIPGEIMTAKGQKWILKEVLYKYVPKELIERPKTGFGIPVGQWIRDPLREWAEDLLSTIKADGFFEPDRVQKLWNSHLDRKADNTFTLWGILMFQAWLREYR